MAAARAEHGFKKLELHAGWVKEGHAQLGLAGFGILEEAHAHTAHDRRIGAVLGDGIAPLLRMISSSGLMILPVTVMTE